MWARRAKRRGMWARRAKRRGMWARRAKRRGMLRHQPQDDVIDRTDVAHPRKHLVQEELTLLFEPVTALGHDGDLEVSVPRVEGGRRDADVGRASDEQDGVDAAAAQRELQVRAVKRRPAMLGHV